MLITLLVFIKYLLKVFTLLLSFETAQLFNGKSLAGRNLATEVLFFLCVSGKDAMRRRLIARPCCFPQCSLLMGQFLASLWMADFRIPRLSFWQIFMDVHQNLAAP